MPTRTGSRTLLWTPRRGPDHRREPPRAATIPPVGTEHLRMARRTQAGDENAVCSNPSVLELFARRYPRVEIPTVGPPAESGHRRVRRGCLRLRFEPARQLRL